MVKFAVGWCSMECMDIRKIQFVVGLLWLVSCSSAEGDDAISFNQEIRPLLSENCFFCHGPDAGNRQADLRLDQAEDALMAIVPGNRGESPLMQRLVTDDADMKMPPAASHRSLTAEEIERIGSWIDQGATWGEHWSLAELRRPSQPVEVTTSMESPASVSRNTIDTFVQHRLGKSDGLKPAPLADRRTLIRRLTLDLTGLPPTVAEVDQFLHDDSVDAYQRLVDRLLVTPAFGQRMAWNWLDAARYADTNGYQGDGERTMWPWRDWVVDAINASMPFDQFTIWQIAGDLLPEPTRESRLATGFLRNHPINGEGGRIAEENRVDYVMDMSETVGTVWLGLTLNCCRCHDHKYDALTQRNYYQLTAFFNQTSVDGSGGNPQTPPVLEWPSGAQSEQLALLQRNVDNARATSEAAQANVELDAPAKDQATAALLQAEEALQGLRNSIPKIMVMEDLPTPRQTFVLTRGLYTDPGEEVGPDVPESVLAFPDDAPRNRLGLAAWMVDEAQPLTARVAANRIWQMLFGIGLVKTSEDFGVQGEIPQHLELLDYLASRYRENGWDTKQLVREIVCSHTYQQSSQASPDDYAADPENRWLARGARFRMPAWMIRDQVLAASGLLVDTYAGPSVNVYQPEGVWEEATFGNKKYQQDHGAALYRRSLYVFWRRIAAPTMFFDNAARQTCEVKAIRTNTPLHSLMTFNDITYVEAARVLAQQCMATASDDFLARLDFVYRRILGRPADRAEQALLQAAWQDSLVQYQQQPELATAMLSAGEAPRDATLDQGQHAAWTALCLAIFNFDETLTKE